MSAQYCVFGLTTTGPTPKKHQVLEIAFVLLDKELQVSGHAWKKIWYDEYTISKESVNFDFAAHHNHKKGVRETLAYSNLIAFFAAQSNKPDSGKLKLIGHDVSRSFEHLKSFFPPLAQYCDMTVTDTASIAAGKVIEGKLPQGTELSLNSLCAHYEIETSTNKKNMATREEVQAVVQLLKILTACN